MSKISDLFKRSPSVSKERWHYEIGKNPSLDWFLVLIVFVVLTACIVLSTLSYFSRAARIDSGDASPDTEALPNGVIERVTGHYEGLRAERNTVLENPAVPPDPSK